MKSHAKMIAILASFLVVGFSRAQIPTFEDIAPSAGVNNDDLGMGAAFIDINNDGLDDIHLINDSQPYEYDHLYLNQGDLTFADITHSAGVWDPAFSNCVRIADIDNDGWQDMIVTTSNAIEGNKLYRNNGDNSFRDWFPRSGIRNFYLVAADWADLDNNGWVDLYYATHEWYPRGVLWRATGPGTYRYAYQTSQTLWFICDVHFCDFEGDGDQDLLQGDLYAYNLLFENDFPHLVELAATAGVAGNYDDFKYHIIGDYDNDGLFDIFAINFTEWGNSPDCLYRQTGPMQFSNVIATSGIPPMDPSYCGGAGDLDNDGWLDLLILDATTGSTRFWHNNGDGTFTDVAPQAGLALSNQQAFAPVLGDINADGFLDIYLVRYGPANRLFLSEGNDNHWLQVALQGTASNRLGIGARVKTVAGDLVQWRDPGGGNWGGSSNAPYVHLGLGDRAVVDSLYVLWPSGQVDILTDIPADQRITVMEGAQIAACSSESFAYNDFYIGEPCPNPFNATTVLSFELRVTSFVNLGVYDLSGRKVVDLVNSWREAGRHEVTFDGSGLASGVYVYRLKVDRVSGSGATPTTMSGKMVLMK